MPISSLLLTFSLTLMGAGELMKQAERYLAENVHPRVLVEVML